VQGGTVTQIVMQVVEGASLSIEAGHAFGYVGGAQNRR